MKVLPFSRRNTRKRKLSATKAYPKKMCFNHFLRCLIQSPKQQTPIFIQLSNNYCLFIRNQLFPQAAPTTLIHHQTLHHQRRLTRNPRRPNQSRKSRKPRSQSFHHLILLILILLMPSQLKRDQELPLTFPLPPREAPTKPKRNPRKLLSHKRKLRIPHLILIHQKNLLSQSRKPPRKLTAPPDLDLTLTLVLMPSQRLPLLPQLPLRMPLPSLTSTMVNLNSSFKDSPSILMRMDLEPSSDHTENFPSANSSWEWEDPREKLSSSTPITSTLEPLLTELTKKTSMVELSGLNSPDKLLVDTNHKVALMEHQLVRPTPFSLETLDSELNNGPLKNSSRPAELLTESELLWVRTVDQEDSLTLNSIATLLLSKP